MDSISSPVGYVSMVRPHLRMFIRRYRVYRTTSDDIGKALSRKNITLLSSFFFCRKVNLTGTNKMDGKRIFSKKHRNERKI